MMTLYQAEKVILQKLPHDANCQRHKTGTWDHTGTCERCEAFVQRNLILSGQIKDEDPPIPCEVCGGVQYHRKGCPLMGGSSPDPDLPPYSPAAGETL